MKNKKLLISLALALLLAALMLASTAAITLTIKLNQFTDLAKYFQEGMLLSLESSNPGCIATSGTGVVAYSLGSATVTAYYFDAPGASAPSTETFYITAENASNWDMSESMTLYVGGSRYLGGDSYLTVNNITSTDTAIASAYNNGNALVINGNAAGNCIITADVYKYYGQLTPLKLSVYVTVNNSQPYLNENILLDVGDTGYIEQRFQSVGDLVSTDSAVAYAFFDGSRINVTGNANGVAVITGTGYNYNGTKTAVTLYVTVKEGATSSYASKNYWSSTNTYTNSIKYKDMSVTVAAGKTAVIDETYYKLYEIKSSNPGVAFASFGNNKLMISGYKAGTCTITCKAKSSDKATEKALTFTVTVNGPATTTAASGSGNTASNASTTTVTTAQNSKKSAGISFVSDGIDGKEGKTYTVNGVRVNGKSVRSASLVWKSTDTDVATVTKTGKVKCVGSGLAYINVSTKDGKYTAQISVNVD